MNKVAITIAVVAACVAAAFAVPAPKVVNWSDVEAKVGEIKGVVASTLVQVRTIANNDNVQVGSIIGAKVDAAIVNATALLTEANALVASQTLTSLQARALVGEVKATIGRLTGNIQADLALLTPPIAVQIRQILATSFDSIEIKAQELVALLQL